MPKLLVLVCFNLFIVSVALYGEDSRDGTESFGRDPHHHSVENSPLFPQHGPYTYPESQKRPSSQGVSLKQKDSNSSEWSFRSGENHCLTPGVETRIAKGEVQPVVSLKTYYHSVISGRNVYLGMTDVKTGLSDDGVPFLLVRLDPARVQMENKDGDKQFGIVLFPATLERDTVFNLNWLATLGVFGLRAYVKDELKKDAVSGYIGAGLDFFNLGMSERTSDDYRLKGVADRVYLKAGVFLGKDETVEVFAMGEVSPIYGHPKTRAHIRRSQERYQQNSDSDSSQTREYNSRFWSDTTVPVRIVGGVNYNYSDNVRLTAQAGYRLVHFSNYSGKADREYDGTTDGLEVFVGCLVPLGKAE